MNHLIDTDDETIEDPESYRREDSKHLKLLEILIEKSIKRLEDKSCKPRIQDALKAIKLKQQVVKTSEVERSETHRAEKIFWQEIENIRNEELPKLYPETLNLEYQIMEVIIGIKSQGKMAFFRSKPLPISRPRIRALSIKANPKKAGLLITALAGSFPPWALARQKHQTAPPPSSGMTIFFYGEFRTNLKIHFLTMKKIKKQPPVRSETPETPVSQVRYLPWYERHSSYRKATEKN